MPGELDEQAVTLSITHRVRPGREEDFEEFAQALYDEIQRFPGFLGARVVRPRRGSNRYRIILRFDSISNLQRWENSEERLIWYERGEDLAEAPPRAIDITGTAQELPLAIARAPLDEFVRTSVSGVGLLLLGAFIALVIAHTPLFDSYERFWTAEFRIGTADYGITTTLRHWVNDGLMALFFFMIGLEIKREVLVGELRYPRQAALPLAAAVGGSAIPALIYLMLNWGGDYVHGWGIPVGTDTAFALGILSLLAARVPSVLVIFLTASTIVDDILAVLIIALFYSDNLAFGALGVAALLMGVLILANLAGVRAWPFYAVLGIAVWLAIYKSGVHGTVAGVLVAAVIPARSWINPNEFVLRARRLLDDFEAAGYRTRSMLANEVQQRTSHTLERLFRDVQPPLTYFEHLIQPWVSFVVLPIFALANAGIPFFDELGNALTSPVTWGVALGLFIGKPVGITLISWLAVRSGIALLPAGIEWRQILAVGTLAGIGFTMSLFITELAFGTGDVADQARMGVLLASVTAGTLGYLALKRVLPEADETPAMEHVEASQVTSRE